MDMVRRLYIAVSAEHKIAICCLTPLADNTVSELAAGVT